MVLCTNENNFHCLVKNTSRPTFLDNNEDKGPLLKATLGSVLFHNEKQTLVYLELPSLSINHKGQ